MRDALAQDRPSLIIVRTLIGYGSPVQDTAKAHGSPLGSEGVAATRRKLDWNYPPFEIPAAIYSHWREHAGAWASAQADWETLLARYTTERPAQASELQRVIDARLPDGWRAALPRFEPPGEIATRKSGARALNAFASVVPELIGGAADLVSSTYTEIEHSGSLNDGDWGARNLHFGVREHAMGAICNGMAAHGGVRVFCSTFFAFSDYMREPIRLAALMQLPVIFVFTHDSIGLGEDGPTHQPVEQLASLRAMPGMVVIRPADANESAQAWVQAIACNGPTALVLSRQALPILDPAKLDVASGASIVEAGDDAVIIATGSEVGLALQARRLLQQQHGIAVRVVSLSSWEIFRAQDEAVRNAILPPALAKIAVEAASPLGWLEFADEVIGLQRFGASAPAADLFERLGFTAEAIAERVLNHINSRRCT